jgi:hypothetical protein
MATHRIPPLGSTIKPDSRLATMNGLSFAVLSRALDSMPEPG